MKRATESSFSRGVISWPSTSSIAASSSDQRSTKSSLRTWSFDLK